MARDEPRGETLRIEIFPADLDATVRFYTRVLGFDLVRDERTSDVPYVALVRGEVHVGAARRDARDMRGRRPPLGVELVLETDDLLGARQRVVDAGWPLEEDLTERPWGLRDVRILDPSGYYWRLTDRAS